MNCIKSTLLAATALTIFTIPLAASAQTAPGATVVLLPAPSTTNAPAQCQGGSFEATTAAAISADGGVVAGTASTSDCVVLWRNGIPEVQVGSYPGFPSIGNRFSNISGLSGNGQTIVGFENDTNGSFGLTRYWTAATDLQFFPEIETLSAAQFNARFPTGITTFTDRSSATGAVQRLPLNDGYVNGDGSVFALNSGYSFDSSNGGRLVYDGLVVLWRRGVGYAELPTFGTNTAMEASGIDASGNRVAGTVRFDTPPDRVLETFDKPTAAFVWDVATGLTRLPDLAAVFSNPAFLLLSGATGISRDGSTVLGYSRAADGIFHPVFWRGGSITDLGFLSGRVPTTTDQFDANAHIVRAASAGGTVIVGKVGSDCCGGGPTTDRAWRWSAATGMQELQQIALNAGLNLNGYTLYEANGISDDGQFISGNAYNGASSEFGFVLQLAQVTQSRLIVTIRLPGVTQTSIVNQTFNTQVDALLNGTNVFTRTVTDPINGAGGVTALADALSALQVGGGLRRVVIGAPTLLSNVTTVLGTTNNTVDVASGTITSTATVNTFGPAVVATGDLGTCATAAANNVNPTGCSLPGTPVTVDTGILNSNVFTNTINTVTPTTTPTVNQLITARWQVSATAGNQFGTVHALVGPAAFERGDRLIGQLLGTGGSDASTANGLARAAMPMNDESGLGGGESGLTMFGGYFGSRSSIDADASIPVARIKGDSDGFVLGLQQSLSDAAHIGIAVDHGNSDYTVRDPFYPERLKLKHTQAALFAGWSEGGFSLNGAASYGFGTTRTSLLTPTTPAIGSRDVNSWSLGAQVGYAVALGKETSLTPHVGIRHTSAKLKRFTETGGPTPLLGLSQTVDRTRFYAGLEAKAGIDLGGVTLTPRVYGRIARDSGDASGTADLVFASAPTGPVMQALGPGVGKTVGELGGGLDAAVSDSISIWASYDGTFRDHANSNSAKGGLTVRW